MSEPAEERVVDFATITEYPLFLEPLDVLRFGDGRSAAVVERTDTVLPTPQPVAGAILTALLTRLGADFDQLAAELRQGALLHDAVRSSVPSEYRATIGRLTIMGPWLARRQPDGTVEPLVAAPHDLYWAEHRGKRRLVTAKLVVIHKGDPERDDPSDLVHLFVSAPGKLTPCRDYLTLEGLARYLADEPLDERHVVPASELYRLDTRVGTAIDPATVSSAHGMLYVRQYLSFRPGVGLYVSVRTTDLPEVAKAIRSLRILPLGGGRRYVRVHQLDRTVEWPEPDLDKGTAFLLFTTPTFVCGTETGLLYPATRWSLIVRDRMAVSGWNYALRAPKPKRLAATAGAICITQDAFRPLLPNPLHNWPEDRFSGWGCWVAGRRMTTVLH